MRSKQYAKKLLSLIIASVMIVTMLPVSALAAGADDVMIEDQAETIVEEAADVSGEVVEEAAEVPDIEDSEDAAIVEGAVDEIAEADPEELTGFTDGSSVKVEGELSGSNMQFDAQLTGLSVSAVVPAKRAAKGSYMTADIVDVSAYEDAVAKKNYGKSIAGLYGLELHFYDKKGKEIKHINTSKITVTVDGLEASSYFIGRIDNKVKKIQRGTEPTFTFTEKKAYTYVIAGLEDDGLIRATAETDRKGNKRFNLNEENVNIEVVAPKSAFAEGVAMEASDVTNGANEDGEEALVGASSDEVVAAYEISFYNEDGDEQQPSKGVAVTINTPLDMTKSYKLIHIADDGTSNEVEGAKFTENGVEFVADSFSVYAVVLSDENGAFDFDEVIGTERVKVKAPDGAFPAGTEMRISGVDDMKDLAKVAASLDSTKVHTLFALDISFWYEGSEIEPKYPVEVTWVSANIDSDDCQLMHLSDEGKVEPVEGAAISSDKAVFTADTFSEYILVGTERQSSVPVEYFVFNPSTLSTDAESITSGEIAANAPKIDEYTFKNATVALEGGGTDIAIEVGAFIARYEDNENSNDKKEVYNVYYRTADTLEASDIIVLVAKQKITLNYERTPFDVTYKVVYNGTTYTIGTDTLPADLSEMVLTGPDAVNENTTYEQAVVLSLPRGYSATVRMSNESSNQAPSLGAGSEPNYTCTDGWTVTPNDYPFTIDGTYTIANVTSNLIVTVNVTKRSSYRFTAQPAFNTAYFGGTSTARYQQVSPSATYNFSGNSTEFSFITRNSTNVTWAMDSLNINKQSILVPFVDSSTRNATTTTTLESGTVITVSAQYIASGTYSGNRRYTISVSNCYENITITGGNLHNITDKPEWVLQERENLSEFDYGKSTYLPLVAGEPMTYDGWDRYNSSNAAWTAWRNGTMAFTSRVIRFKVADGYVNPQLKYITPEGSDDYTRVGDVTLASAATDFYHLITSEPDPDGYYYFSLKGNSSSQYMGLLSARAELARYGVSYDRGGVSGAIIPEFDNGGTYGDGTLRGYNIEDNNMIAISKIVPSDPSKNYVFLYYTIDGDTSATQYAPSQKVPLASVSKYAVYNSSKEEYEIPLTAHWIEAEQAETVTIRVKFFLDAASEADHEVDVQVTKGASVYIDIDSDEMIEFMEQYNWQLFYDEVGSNPYIESALEDKEVDLQLYSKFYVYHSATDTLELHTTKEMLKNGAIGTLDLKSLTTSGFYYGGYYKDYLGAHVGNTASGKNLVKEAADKNNSDGLLSPADIVTLSGGGAVEIPEFTGAATKYAPQTNPGHLKYWTRANAFMENAKKNSTTAWFGDRGSKDTAVLQTGGKGDAVTIARAGIYYLHEVPRDYLATPKVATVRDEHGKGKITKMFLLSVVDISIFKAGGVKVKTTDTKGSFAQTFTLTQYDEGTDTVTNDEQTPSSLFSVNGYLTVTDGASCIASGTYALDPYWITYDGITVHGSDVVEGHVRTITVANNTVS